jgi:hypothetical protein
MTAEQIYDEVIIPEFDTSNFLSGSSGNLCDPVRKN